MGCPYSGDMDVGIRALHLRYPIVKKEKHIHCKSAPVPVNILLLHHVSLGMSRVPYPPSQKD